MNITGKFIKTKTWYPLSDKECDEIREEHYQKPSIEEVDENLRIFHKNKITWKSGRAVASSNSKNISTIVNYYFKGLMEKTRIFHCKWSIEEVFQCNDLIRHIYGQTFYKMRNDGLDRKSKVDHVLQVGNFNVAMYPTQFPISLADDIIGYYCFNRNYYDFSCGWGVRMLSAMRNGIKYFGTDPNDLLVEQLYKLHHQYKSVNGPIPEIDIRCQGSEVLVPEWEGMMGLSFSSPPYFDLEDYRVGNQSYSEGMSYELWLDSYVRPTIRNITRYLTDKKYLLINIKNSKEHLLYDDFRRMCIELGFRFIEDLTLKNIQRTTRHIHKDAGTGNRKKLADTSEKIMVMRLGVKKLSERSTLDLFLS